MTPDRRAAADTRPGRAVVSGACPEPRHAVPMADAEFDGFLSGIAPDTPALAAE